MDDSINNYATIRGAWCGCYNCIEVFKGKEVEHFVDSGKTALCPKCGIDSVIPHQKDKEELSRLHCKYFGISP